MSRTDLLHWRTSFYVLPPCLHNTIAARLIARTLADDDPRLVTALITERGVCAASRDGLTALYPDRPQSDP